MSFYKRYKFQRISAVQCGLLIGFAADVMFKPYAGINQQSAFDLDNYGILYYALMMLMLCALAVLIQYYVKPFSKIGAFMTGFCGYTILFFILA